MAAAAVTPAGTAEGHSWVCGSCPFRTTDIMKARAHVQDAEERYRAGRLPFQHAMYETKGGDRDKGKIARWIYTTPQEGELRLGDFAAFKDASPLYPTRRKRAEATA